MVIAFLSKFCLLSKVIVAFWFLPHVVEGDTFSDGSRSHLVKKGSWHYKLLLPTPFWADSPTKKLESQIFFHHNYDILNMSISDMPLHVISRDFKSTGCSKIKQNRHPQVILCVYSMPLTALSLTNRQDRFTNAFLRDLLIPQRNIQPHQTKGSMN